MSPSRKRRQRRPNAPSAPSPPRRRRHPAVRWGAATLVLIVVAIAAVRMLAERDTIRRSAAPAIAYVDSLGRPMTPPDQMNARTAYETAVALARAGVHSGSLPYFQRALALRPDLWQVQCDYAASVLNAAIEVGEVRGRPAPLSRSSVERIAGVRDAFAHLAEAERLATSPADRAYVVELRARHLALWGLGWDAFDNYRRASEIEPGNGRIRNEMSWQARLLRDAVEPGK